jgi:hypothetical protein
MYTNVYKCIQMYTNIYKYIQYKVKKNILSYFLKFFIGEDLL